ncbi:hypothetical protein ACFY8S_01455 [Streptomyces hygroscopicus]
MSGTSGSVSAAAAAAADAEYEILCDVQADVGVTGSDFVVLSTREL